VTPDKLATSPDEIIREARDRLRLAADAESSNRTNAITALQFRNGEQWPVDVRRDRDTDSRPCLTVNLTDAVTRRVENACRENRPRIKIDPVGEGADIETAKVLNGLTRHVEAISGADHAYDCAQSSAIAGGWGWISIANDYVDEQSFDQELFIVAHRNPFKVYGDPASQMPDGSDLAWLIESEMVSRIDYKQRYGELDPGGWEFLGPGDGVSDWSNKEQIRVAKYWRIETKPDTLLKLADGRSVLKSTLSNGALKSVGMVTQERPTMNRQVKCYLLSCNKILKSWDWPGRYIPYVPVYGRTLDLNGKVVYKGMIQDLMDPGRMYNYSETAKTELYGLQPKAPWLGVEGFMAGHEPAWRDANRKPIVGLEYKQQYAPDGNTPLPPPQRQMPPPVSEGFQEWSQSAQSNFMAVAGMPHEPNQDAKGEVVSGIALKKREGLADISHFDFYDNFCRSLKQLGRILVDLYPHFYSAERMQRIIREDGTSELVPINQQQVSNGVQTVKNNLQVGRYDVTVDTGPAYQTKRQESAEALLELVTGTGKLGEMIAASAADKVLRQFDFPDADAMADRLMALIPAAQAEKQMGNMSQDQLKAMVAGLQGQLQQANHQLMAAHLEIEAKHGLEKIKQEGEDRRAHLKAQTELARETIEDRTWKEDVHTKAITAHNVKELDVAGKIIVEKLKHGHEEKMADRELSHAERELGAGLYDSERDRQHESSEANKGREHEAAEADKGRRHESTESSRDRGHQSKESQHQRGHEARQGSADRNKPKPK
jgi:hypothetical protein